DIDAGALRRGSGRDIRTAAGPGERGRTWVGGGVRMPRSWFGSAVLALVGVAAFDAHAEPQWKMAAPLPKAIGEIEAATVNGKIYVLSGLDNLPGVVTPTGYNWLYDPATNAWTDRKSMPVPPHHIMVATSHDKIYVFGGFVRPPSFVA